MNEFEIDRTPPTPMDQLMELARLAFVINESDKYAVTFEILGFIQEWNVRVWRVSRMDRNIKLYDWNRDTLYQSEGKYHDQLEMERAINILTQYEGQ